MVSPTTLVFLIGFGCVLIAGNYGVESAKKATALTIGDATKFCEKAVPEHCISKTCPEFCNTIRSPRAKKNCMPECRVDKRCKLKAAAGTDDPANSALDAQNREQLWACIAEKRDPDNKVTGRRTTPWKQLETPSFKKAVGRT